MVGEKFEHKEGGMGGEQFALYQNVGQKVTGALLAELREMKPAERMEHFPWVLPSSEEYWYVDGMIASGRGTDEAYQAIFGDRYQSGGDGDERPVEESRSDGEEESENEEMGPEAREAIARVVEESKDRYGNSISADSIANLYDLAQKDPEKFAQEMLEHDRQQQREAASKGYENAQSEIARILAGRTPEEYLEVAADTIQYLQKEIDEEKGKIYPDELKDYHQRMINEAEATLKELHRKYALIANLGKGEDAVPVSPRDVNEMLELPENLEEESNKTDLRTELLDVSSATYETEKDLRRQRFEYVAQYLQPAEAKRLLDELESAETLEKELKDKARADFETSPIDDETGTDEDIRRAAEEAGRSSSDGGGHQSSESRSRKQASREYWDGLHNWSVESKVSGDSDQFDRFGEPILPTAERQGILKKLGGKLSGRASWKKVGRNALKGVLVALMAGSVLSSVSSAGRIYAAEATESSQDNLDAESGQQIASVLENSGLTGDSARALAESLGMSVEDLVGGEVDFSTHDLLAEGNMLYDGIAERPSSFVAPSGMIMDMAKYNDEARHGNSFAASIADLKDDKEALVNALMQNSIELPYQLASTTAAMPELLRACGVDETIITNENVAERAQAVMDAMLSEGGGDLQKKLAAALNIALHNENTNIAVYQEYGLERTFYVRPFDVEKLATGESKIELRTDVKQRDGNWQVQVDVAYAGGDHEVIDLNLGCGGQVNMYTESYAVRVVITDEDNVEKEITIETNDEVVEETSEDEDDSEEEMKDEEEPGDDEDDETPPEDEEDEDDGGEDEEEEDEVIKPKDPESLVEGVEQALEDAGSENEINQTPNLDEFEPGESVTNNDGTVSNVNPETGEVESVTDGGTGETVVVESGDTTPPQQVTEATDNAITSGTPTTDSEVIANENAEIDSMLGRMQQRVEADMAAQAQAANSTNGEVNTQQSGAEQQ